MISRFHDDLRVSSFPRARMRNDLATVVSYFSPVNIDIYKIWTHRVRRGAWPAEPARGATPRTNGMVSFVFTALIYERLTRTRKRYIGFHGSDGSPWQHGQPINFASELIKSDVDRCEEKAA